MLNPADDAFVQKLAEAVPDLWLGAPEPRYLEEPRGRWKGQAGVLAKPATTAQVSALMAFCHAARVGVVPYGGGTGLVGGQVCSDGPAPVLVSLEKMTALRAMDAQSLVIEAGATLQTVQDHAASAGRRFPLTLASQGSAQIGGCLATNAGGVNVLRYGNARALCLGLEVVLADGTIWHGLKRLAKDNTGYDLRDLVIGAEGSLGLITAASLRLYEPPAVEGTAVFAVTSPQAAVELLGLAQARFAGCVSAFELISGWGLGFLRDVGPEVHLPFAQDPDWSVLIDLGLPAGMEAEAAFADLYEAAGDRVTDAVVAQSAAQAAQLWQMRESIPLANRRIGAISSHDIAVPVAAIPDFIAEATALLNAMGDFRLNCFGHVGDGNLHFNVFPAEGRSRSDYDAPPVMEAVHKLVVERFDGSISAEHGIGRLKVGELARTADPAKLAMMQAVKTALDPRGILNPGVILPAPQKP
ncbi:FAD/FMN-containing dehydrogenase [Rhodobacter aestuarii]|uniref:FAD/FMN-containing dehydrogenase n=1 Tax=Rhodobacter aestuarii TaxID=453582 RepID=A0A1N7K1Z0_9RHOB|nr:FAD-binding oxidoreductase [Rhodobacter aestuarii]PTV95893.1 FAD/FMN-containing dehydrogenase [Rhodobacter aestuarii]SIS55612.1 FAD/FMN-containing dehydrogenase [Rhodobacter aestuarii]